jgi:transposase
MISDQAWDSIRKLLPARPPRVEGGRPPIGDREVLTGVLFVLKTGIPWEDLPREMGCGCGMTCLRRLRQWQHSGTWLKIQDVLRMHLRDSARFDWGRARRGERSPMRARGFPGRLSASVDAHESAAREHSSPPAHNLDLPGREARSV